jgi:predicted acetyltransferase
VATQHCLGRLGRSARGGRIPEKLIHGQPGAGSFAPCMSGYDQYELVTKNRFSPLTVAFWPTMSSLSVATLVQRHQVFARGAVLPDEFVPETFLVAMAAGDIIGRVSIRHELNTFLAAEGGRIGYGVLPGLRRRGFATQML